MTNQPIYVLLADDDEDDRLFFMDAFEEIKIKTVVQMVNDGQELMDHLIKPDIVLPDVLFLDLNMPRKTGMECLNEIKNIERLKNVAIAIYSTSASEEDIEETFVKGANVYIKKPKDQIGQGILRGVTTHIFYMKIDKIGMCARQIKLTKTSRAF
jgi:CheY-like chemotaxis protein